MGRCRIAQLVDRVDDRIRRRVAADGVVHAPDIVVDRARQTHNGEAVLLREQLCAAQGAVTADDAEPLDTTLDEILMPEAAAFGGLPTLAACCPEEGAAALNDVAHILGLEFTQVLLEQSVIAVVDPPYLHALIECRACNRACRRIHPRAVAPTRHDCNTL